MLDKEDIYILNQKGLYNLNKLLPAELVDEYLSAKDVRLAQKVIKTYKLPQTKIQEFNLKQNNYKDGNLLKLYLPQLMKHYQPQESFKQLTHIILYQKVDSSNSLVILLDHCQALLKSFDSETEDHKEYLR